MNDPMKTERFPFVIRMAINLVVEMKVVQRYVLFSPLRTKKVVFDSPGLVEMTSGLVNASFSLPQWQAIKVIFFAPCSIYICKFGTVLHCLDTLYEMNNPCKLDTLCRAKKILFISLVQWISTFNLRSRKKNSGNNNNDDDDDNNNNNNNNNKLSVCPCFYLSTSKRN